MPCRFIAAVTVLLAILAYPGVAVAANGFTTGDVNLRAGPGTHYPAVTTVRAGSDVTIHGCLSGYAWCDISWAGIRGWIAGRYLETWYERRRVVVPAYGLSVGLPIVGFTIDRYWNDHYRSRHFYRDRDRWDRDYRIRARRDRDRWDRPHRVRVERDRDRYRERLDRDEPRRNVRKRHRDTDRWDRPGPRRDARVKLRGGRDRWDRDERRRDVRKHRRGRDRANRSDHRRELRNNRRERRGADVCRGNRRTCSR